jgi:NAD(P)H-flavin reductase
MLIGIAGHVIAWGVADGDEGAAATAGSANNTTWDGHDDDNPTVPIISFCSFLLFLAMGLLAVEPVRRRAYFIFFKAHQIAAYLTVPVTLAHADGAFIFLLPGLTVWLVDRIMRYKRAPQAATLLDSRDCADDVVMLRFTQPGLVVAPGQFVFVQVPEISTFEWHPFTVAAINVEKSEFTLFVKAMKAPVPVSGCELPYFYLRWLPKRELTWTQQLQGAVRNRAAITLCVDGPCGAVHDLSTFQQVIFIAGGVGITPCAAHMQRLRGAIQARRIELHWAVRDPALAAPFAAQLDPIADDTRYCGTLYVTRGASADTAEDFKADPLGPSTALTVVSGRPNLVQIMDAFAANKDVLPSATAVVVCGPPGMVDVCARMAICRGFTIIEDSFTFL